MGRVSDGGDRVEARTRSGGRTATAGASCAETQGRPEPNRGATESQGPGGRPESERRAWAAVATSSERRERLPALDYAQRPQRETQQPSETKLVLRLRLRLRLAFCSPAVSVWPHAAGEQWGTSTQRAQGGPPAPRRGGSVTTGPRRTSAQTQNHWHALSRCRHSDPGSRAWVFSGPSVQRGNNDGALAQPPSLSARLPPPCRVSLSPLFPSSPSRFSAALPLSAVLRSSVVGVLPAPLLVCTHSLFPTVSPPVLHQPPAPPRSSATPAVGAGAVTSAVRAVSAVVECICVPPPLRAPSQP